MITVQTVCNLKKTNSLLEKLKKIVKLSLLDTYGKMGVEELRKRTPENTGRLAESWDYSITNTKDGAEISWFNKDIEGGYNVAILIQYGHATKSGGYIPGRDFINPAIEVVLAKVEEDLRKEMS